LMTLMTKRFVRLIFQRMPRLQKMIRHQQEKSAPSSAKQSQPSASEKELSGKTKELLLQEHPELAMQAGLVKQTKVNKDKKRKQYYHEGIKYAPSLFQALYSKVIVAGRLVYEWDQSLDEVNIYIDPPPGLTASQFDIDIKSDHLMVGIKGNAERYLNVSFAHCSLQM
jgi:hypothetical protein